MLERSPYFCFLRGGWVPVILVFILATLTALAHATPQDQTWIRGLYDDADYDDVILLVTSASAATDSPKRAVDAFRTVIDLVPVSATPSVTAHHVRLHVPRGPPAV